VTYFSGIVDEHDHVRLGGYPGAFRDVLGVRTEEFYPLHAGETVQLDDGTTASVWTELLHLAGAEAVRRFVDGPLAGVPAVTRHTYGAGTGWYVPTRLDPAGVSAVVEQVLTEAGGGAGSRCTAGGGDSPPGRQRGWLSVCHQPHGR
jgi:beta-galactosidase